jgi:tRNA(Ile2)-agmatinylcytidine synthase
MRKTMHLGLDDTDSTRNGCTTYLAALLVEKLEHLQVEFIDYPNLVRLNPNVPWKTRGNGALCLRFEFEENLENEIKKIAINLVEECADMDIKGTDPGLVFFEKRNVPKEINAFAKKTETNIVTLKEATALINEFKAEAVGYNTCRGIIGALAAIGETLEGDHTFELIAYRTEENRGSKRQVDEDSIFEMERQTQPYTFNNVDKGVHRVIITPRGPDPILLGIRGETPEIVKKAFMMVKPLEPVERWLVFRTNQGTDMHLTHAPTLSQIKPYHSVIAKGAVSKNPHIIPVRHVIFAIKDSTAEVDCAAFEPTGELRRVAQELIEGDDVEVYGAVRHSKNSELLTVNLEKINIQMLAPKIIYRNPTCPKCGKRCESMGKGKGFRCKKCGAKFKITEKTKNAQDRHVELGLHFTSTRSQRHLTKPLRRYGLEKSLPHGREKMIKDWHS